MGRSAAGDPRGRFLLSYGLRVGSLSACCWAAPLFALLRLQEHVLPIGYVGGVLSLLMVAVIGKNLFGGIFGKEFGKMLTRRRRFGLCSGSWLLIGGPLSIMAIPYRDRAAGTFLVRPSTRVEINALEAGFLRDIALEEGSRMSAGTQIACINIPDLEVNISKKLAEIRESEANLRKLKAGPRPEEVLAQRQRVQRALAWKELGGQDLERAKQVYQEEMFRLDRQSEQFAAEVEQRRQSLSNAEKLHKLSALSGEQLLREKTKLAVKSLELEQVPHRCEPAKRKETWRPSPRRTAARSLGPTSGRPWRSWRPEGDWKRLRPSRRGLLD